MIGHRRGHHRIVGKIGAGGSGEVYGARDPRLYRIVAIEILCDHLADLVQLRARFAREAKTIARLNHPHICTLCKIASQDEVYY